MNEWRRRVMYLFVTVVLITSVIGVPTYAQVELENTLVIEEMLTTVSGGNYEKTENVEEVVQNDAKGESNVLTGDVDLNTMTTVQLEGELVQSTETENVMCLSNSEEALGIVSISANVARNTFYYEVDEIYDEQAIDSIDVTFDDGTMMNISMFTNVAEIYYGIYCEIQDLEGNVVKRDENGKCPIGDYICKIFHADSGVNCEVPIQVVSVETVAKKLVIGESITGLSGTDKYGDQFPHDDFDNGHWLKIELTEMGSYELFKSEDGIAWIFNSNWEEISTIMNGNTQYIHTDEEETYYCCVKGSNTFDVTLEKLPNITEFKVNVGRDTFYYEPETIDREQIVDSLELILDDGTVENCEWTNDVEMRYGVTFSLIDMNGNVAQYDELGRYSVGEYLYKIVWPIGGVCSEIPIKIVSLDDVAIEIEVGETITKLPELLDNGYYEGYANGYWLKMELEEAGEYMISKSDWGKIEFFHPDFGKDEVSSFVRHYLQIDDVKTGTWYCFVHYTSDVTLTKVPIITDIDAVIERDTFYYEVERLWEPYVIDYLELTCDDGTILKCGVEDDIWHRCHLSYNLIDTEGNHPDRDNMYKCSVGEYLLQISQVISEVSYEVPVKVVSVEEIELELIPGETIFELSGTDKGIDTASYRDGHWIKLKISELGKYELTKSKNGIIARSYLNDYAPYYAENTNYTTILVTEPGDYYCYVKGSEVFDISLNKLVDKTLEAAISEMLKVSEVLADDNYVNVSTEEKQQIVSAVLQKIGEIHKQYNIAQTGEVTAEYAIETVAKLTEIEKHIETLLGTSVKVVAEDNEAEKLEVLIANALLSVPAGENAEVRVSTVDIPEDVPINSTSAIAFNVQLFGESQDKMQLQAPVVITINIPDGTIINDEIIIYHYNDAGEIVEPIMGVLNSDGTMSFAIGSFSTLVISNVSSGLMVSGTVTSFGEAANVVLKLLNSEGEEVAETTASNENGLYQFENVESGNYILQITKKNHITSEYTINITDEAVEQNVEIHLLGDVNGDGKINAKDKKIIYNHIAGESVLEEYDFRVGDVNDDGKINAKDKKIIYNHIAGESLLW